MTDRLAAWRYAFRTTNPPEQGVVDGVTRWLVVTRAGVLPMTLTSGLIAVLLAAIADVASTGSPSRSQSSASSSLTWRTTS